MAIKTVIDGGNGVTAGQFAEFFKQVNEGNINFYKLQAFIEGKNPFAFTSLPFWRIVENRANNFVELDRVLKEKDILIGPNVNKPVENIEFPKTETTSLILLSPKDLGFTKSLITYKRIYEKAQAVSLRMCESGIIFQLAAQHDDLVKIDEKIYLGMNAISGLGGLKVIYTIDREYDVLGIDCFNGEDEMEFGLNDRFIFKL